MIESMGLELAPNPNYDAYYGLIDFEFWARKNIGDEAVEYLKKNIHPLDLAFRLAEAHGIVLLNGGGFEAPDWSLRVSLANLPDEAYEDIGRGVRAVARGYRDAYRGVKNRSRRTRNEADNGGGHDDLGMNHGQLRRVRPRSLSSWRSPSARCSGAFASADLPSVRQPAF